jgi:hypothetical protein
MCRSSASADARELGSVMGMIHKIVVQGFEQVASCDDTTEECGMSCECFSSTLDYLLYLN